MAIIPIDPPLNLQSGDVMRLCFVNDDYHGCYVERASTGAITDVCPATSLFPLRYPEVMDRVAFDSTEHEQDGLV